MQVKTMGKAIRLDQLTEEIRALPGLSRLQGLSARSDSSTGEVEISVHMQGSAPTSEEERAIGEAVARHIADPQWGLSADQKEMAAVLSRDEGSLSLGDVEKALRALARVLDLQRPGAMTAAPTTDGSSEE